MEQWLNEKRLKAKETATTLMSLLPSSLYLEVRWRYHKLHLRKEELERERSQRTAASEFRSSLKPFDDTRSIFVHVPKCAGDSIKKSLFGDDFTDVHRTFDEYLNIFDPKSLKSYFKFTFVRNPWDRLVSAFFYIKSGGCGENDRIWFSRELAHFKNFDEFVRGWLNKDNIWKLWYFQPQYYFILERRGKIEMDFFGLYENLGEDFGYISKRLGVNCPVQHMNKRKHEDYRDYYNEETMKIVADVYDADIKLLGYNFDNSSLPKQLAQRSSGKALDLTAPGLRRGNSRHL